jgi:hypothetical protein
LHPAAILPVVTTLTVSAAADHLQRLTGKSPLVGLNELVWNALDADATTVEIKITRTGFDAVDRVIVADNGHGFSAEEVEDLFKSVGGSWKKTAPNGRTKSGQRELHGKKGEGRWKVLAIGDRVTWRSVAATDSDPALRAEVDVTIAADRPNEVEWNGPRTTTVETGTTATVTAGLKEPNVLLRADLRGRLCATFALFLSKFPGVRISVDGTDLDPSSLQTRVETIPLQAGAEHGPATLTIIEWSIDIDRALCLCDANNTTLQETEPGIRAPGFSFTAYISWHGFRVHEDVLGLAELDSNELSAVIDEAREAMRRYFRDRREVQQRSTIEGWQDEGAYPWDQAPTEPAEQATQAIFNYVAVAAAPAVNSIDNAQAKRLSLASIRVAVESDPRSLERIIQEVLKLPQEKVDEFHALLQKTSLTAMLAATKMVTERLELLAGLEHLLFDPHAKGIVKETAHLHRILERATWLFGEEFALHVSDQSLTTLLHRHLKLLGRDELIDKEPVTDAEGGDRRIDFMLGRALELNANLRDHLVVEIKRPSVKLGRVELAQIEDYARAVASDTRFDTDTTRWEFVLVGVEIKPEIEDRRRLAGKPRGLVVDPEGGNLRVWVRTWGEVLEECTHRLKFIRRELTYDPTSDQAMEFLRATYPDFLPTALRGTGGEAGGPVGVQEVGDTSENDENDEGV